MLSRQNCNRDCMAHRVYNINIWEFPGGPVVRTLRFHWRRPPGSIPGWGTKILQAAWCSQKKKEKLISGPSQKSELIPGLV